MSTFDRSDRFQQELPDILTAIAAPRMPDYVDDLLAQAAATRQRPRWTFPERWLPMGAIARRQPYVPTPSWRLFLVAALLLALVAAALLVTAGSQQHVPPPFGPARNGALLFGNGDIYLRDSIDGPARLVIGGPTYDFAAGFTRDGTRLTFLRRVAGTEGSPDERLQMFAADTDGSNPVALTEPLIAPDWSDIAPDNGSMVFISGDPARGSRCSSRTSSSPANLGSSRSATRRCPRASRTISRRPATRSCSAAGPGEHDPAVDPASSPSAPTARVSARSPRRTAIPTTTTSSRSRRRTDATSPTRGGTRVLTGARIHILDLRTGDDRILTDVGRSEGYATFSPDSRRIVFVNYVADTNQIMVAPIDGSSPPVPMGPSYRQVNNKFIGGMFSPDGKWVVVSDPASGETRLVDAAKGGNGTLLAWSAADLSGWQRLAP